MKRFLAALACVVALAWGLPAHATNPVQIKSGFDNGNQTPTLSFNSNLTAGSWVATAIYWTDSTVLNSITDSCGNTYTLLDNPIPGSTSLFFAAQAKGKITTGGSCTISYNFASAPSSLEYFLAVEIEGRDSTDPVGNLHTGQLSSLAGTGSNAVTSGAMSGTPPANSYIFGWAFNVSGITLVQGSGFTPEEINNAWALEDQTGTANECTFTSPSSDFFSVGCMAFQPAGGGGGGGSPTFFQRRLQQ